ncbi:MAG: 5-(carboxyamino)imidazole ribonucleotide mutase [Deltaproteobacteria bacterium]|nr:5-(carboxyamino)imidazole ribonucleotide mutase [Deltaproteobacteria bacterium]
MATKDKSRLGDGPLVGIITGSPNDLELVNKSQEVLTKLHIRSEIKVLSAHRTPALVHEYVSTAQARGIEVLIACAGMANHLGGALAAQTLLPVIGVPLTSGAMGGLDALLSTVQMPPGVPVATVGIDGTRNAAYLAARILAIKYPEIIAYLEDDLEEQRKRYHSANNATISSRSHRTSVSRRRR